MKCKFKFKCKANNFDINLNKELLRIKIIDNLISKYKINKMDFISSLSYKTTKHDPLIINNINGKKLMKKVEYEKLLLEINNFEDNNDTISNNYDSKNNILLTYKNITHSISKKNYYRIKKQIINEDYQKFTTYDGLLWCLINRYSYFNLMNGLFGSVMPNRYLKFGNGQPDSIFEGFGSFLNHTSKYYCGLFYDLEKYFGCIGNFFDCKFKKGLFLINPPFTVDIINKVISSTINSTNKYKKLTYVLIIPTWRIEDRLKLNKICKKPLKTDYKTDVKVQLLLDNKNFISRHLYCKENFPYYDFMDNEIRYFASTDIITIGNKINKNIEEIFSKSDLIINH